MKSRQSPESTFNTLGVNDYRLQPAASYVNHANQHENTPKQTIKNTSQALTLLYSISNKLENIAFQIVTLKKF
jgi:hypothetical protein